ncbi:MAG: S24 family peptidase [Bacteroidales bacterium]|nr:S24 family peptidase [Bacteroidales bacterium]
MDKDEAFYRIGQSVEYLKDNGKARNHEEVAQLMGVPRPNVTAALNGNPRYVTEGFLKKFADAYSDYINKEWLLTGVGQMVKVDKSKFRPRVPLSVSAGYTEVSVGTALEGDCDQEPVNPDFPSYDFTIKVSGDSMVPELHDNDIIACRWLDNVNEVVQGEMYVLDTNVGAVVKEIKIGRTKVHCHSLNPAYKDFSVAKEDVLRIAKVVGLSRVY